MHIVANIVWVFFQLLIGYNLILPLILYISWLLRGRNKELSTPDSDIQSDYAVIVTAYEQTDLLPAVVASLLKMEHPHFIITF